MREPQRMTSRQRSRTLPSRVKHNRENEGINGTSKARTRSKTPLPFRKVVEFLRRRKQKAELDPEFYSLERQGWFHGKISEEFAERPLRKNGDFLVREDPATPGTYFLVLRNEGATLVMPIIKGRSKSSKSSRIKYRIDGLDVSYESVTELITYYWHEKKTISKNAHIFILRPISRDTTLLSMDDKPKPKRLELEKLFEPYKDEVPDGVRTLQHDRRKWMRRQESEPVISPRLDQSDACFNLDVEVDGKLDQNETKNTQDGNIERETTESTSEKAKEISSELEVSKDVDKKDNYSNNNNNTETKPLSGHINSSVHSTDTLKSRSLSSMDRSEKRKARADASSAPSLVQKQSTLDRDTGVYSTPRPATDQLNSFLVDKKTSDDGYYSTPKALENGERSSGETAANDDSFLDYAIPSSRPVSEGDELDLSSSLSFHRENKSKRELGDGFYDKPVINTQSSFNETDMDYAVPSSRPVNDHGAVFSEGTGSVYDVPPSSRNSKPEETATSDSNSNNERKPNGGSRKNSESEQQKKEVFSSEEQKTTSPTAVAPKRKEEIYQEVVRKLNKALVSPFLLYDTKTLARHLTRVDIDVIWRREDLYKPEDAWTSQDGSGAAVGLELIMLPQGRERRAAMLSRYENLKFWVASVLIAAGDVLTRKKVLEKMIDLADTLCAMENGNMISFMAVMEGLAQPQVTRLHHTWSCLHHHNSPRAISYHSNLKPLVGLLASGAPSPFPGVCLPYLIPLARYLEMSTDEILDDIAHDDVTLGIETMIAHLDRGRNVMEQLEVYKIEAMDKLKMDIAEDTLLLEYFKSRFIVSDLLGLAAEGTQRSAKIATLLQWLSENVERSGRPSLSSDSG